MNCFDLEVILNFLSRFSFASIAGYLSYQFGASQYLLLLIQYLFLVDFITGIIDAQKANLLSGKKFYFGLKRLVSLYFALLIVGFGTQAFDVALRDKLDFMYSGAMFFDAFIFILIIFELASINKHLAGLNFGINIQLESFFEKITLKIVSLINKKIDNIDKTDKKDEM